MKFYTDDDRLRIGVLLDRREHPKVDLTADGLGDRILDAALLGMLDAHARTETPEGKPWPELARSTVRRKHHAAIGVDSGKTHFLDPWTWQRLPRVINRRECWIEWPRSDKRWPQCHGWQNGNPTSSVPARRVMGWSTSAIQAVNDLLEEASFRAAE